MTFVGRSTFLPHATQFRTQLKVQNGAIACNEERNGPPGEIRTPDTQVRSLVLYPAELRAGTGEGGSIENLGSSYQRYGIHLYCIYVQYTGSH